MNINFAGAAVGTVLTLAALMPSDVAKQAQQELAPPPPIQVSLEPGNTYIRLNSYRYEPQKPPVFQIPAGVQLPPTIVVFDASGNCIGRLEAGQHFVFVDADRQQCINVPGPRVEVATNGQN